MMCISRLKRGRYAATTTRSCLAAVAHFAHWMAMNHMPVHVLDDDCIDQPVRASVFPYFLTIGCFAQSGSVADCAANNDS